MLDVYSWLQKIYFFILVFFHKINMIGIRVNTYISVIALISYKEHVLDATWRVSEKNKIFACLRFGGLLRTCLPPSQLHTHNDTILKANSQHEQTYMFSPAQPTARSKHDVHDEERPLRTT